MKIVPKLSSVVSGKLSFRIEPEDETEAILLGLFTQHQPYRKLIVHSTESAPGKPGIQAFSFGWDHEPPELPKKSSGKRA